MRTHERDYPLRTHTPREVRQGEHSQGVTRELTHTVKAGPGAARGCPVQSAALNCCRLAVAEHVHACLQNEELPRFTTSHARLTRRPAFFNGGFILVRHYVLM